MDENGVDKNSEQYRGLQREIADTEAQLKKLKKQAKESNAILAQIGAVGEKFKKVGGEIESAGKKILPASAAVAGLGAAAVKTTADFDSSMSKVAAVSGATGEALDELRDKAREMGAKTKFSASEAAEAMNYMAMAGWKTEDMLNGIDGIMNLAAASGEDLALTSDIVTDALTAFGLSAKDSAHFADVLAAASANANTNVSMLGESFKYAAPVAGALGYSVEDTAIALGLMANSGIKASQGGTALRTLFTNMAKPTKDMAAAMEQLGVSLDDGQGNMKSLAEVMSDLREGFGGLKVSNEEFNQTVSKLDKQLADGEITEKQYLKMLGEWAELAFTAEGAEKAKYAAMLAGQKGMSGLLAIVNATTEDYDKLASAIYNADGASEKMANTMLDNLNGQFTILKSQLQELAIQFGDALMPTIKKLVDGLQKFVDKLNGIDESTRNAIITVGLIIAALGPALIIIGKIVSAVGTVMTILPKLSPIITAITGPVGIVIGVITALVAAVVILWNKCDAFREFWINLWDKVKSAFQSFKDWIEPILKPLGEAISGTFKEAWELIKVIWAKVQPFFDNLINAIKIIFKNLDLTTQFKVGFEIVKATWQNIISFFTVLINTLKGVLSVVKNILAGNFQGAWDAVKGIFSSWGSFFEGLIENAKKTFHKVTDIMSKPIEEGKEKIKKALELIKATFDGLKLALPKIKLPHFKISGSFSLDPPSVPKLSIDWYAKAMNYPMLLNSPTIFGAMGGKMLGAGEAGQEVVSGAETLMKMIQSAVKSTLILSNASQSLTGTVRHTGTIRIEGVNNQGEFVAAGNAVLDSLGISGITRLVMDEIQAATDRKAAVY